MKKTIIAFSILMMAFSCKKEKTTENTANTTKEQSAKEEKKMPESAFSKDADGAYTFKFNLEKGKTYPFSISTKGNVVQSDGKNSDKMSQESITSLDYTVEEVKDSTYVLNVKFTRFKEQMDGANGKISYDTNAEKPKNQMVAQQWDLNKAIVGKSFKMEIDKDGKVIDITGLLPVQNAVAKELENVSPEQLSQTLSLSAIQAMFQESTSYYPKQAVKIDETWTKKEGTEKASSTINYTFKGIKDNNATISIKGSSTGKDTQTNQQGVTLYRSLSGNVDGTVKIDEKSGWINSLEVNKKEVMRATQEYKGQKANFSSTTTTETTINK